MIGGQPRRGRPWVLRGTSWAGFVVFYVLIAVDFSARTVAAVGTTTLQRNRLVESWGVQRLEHELGKRPYIEHQDSALTQSNRLQHRAAEESSGPSLLSKHTGWGTEQLERVLGPDTGWRGYMGPEIGKLRATRNKLIVGVRPIRKEKKRLEGQLQALDARRNRFNRQISRSKEKLVKLEQRGIVNYSDQEVIARRKRLLKAYEFGRIRVWMTISKVQSKLKHQDKLYNEQYGKIRRIWRLLRSAIIRPVEMAATQQMEQVKEHINKVL